MYISTVESTTLASDYPPVFTRSKYTLFDSAIRCIQSPRQSLVGTAFCSCVELSNDARYCHRSMRTCNLTLLAMLSYVVVASVTALDALAPSEAIDRRQSYVVLITASSSESSDQIENPFSSPDCGSNRECLSCENQ